MLLRIENSFLQLANKLGKPFSEEDKQKLATSLELNYQNIRSVILHKKIPKNNLNQQLLNWEILVEDSLL